MIGAGRRKGTRTRRRFFRSLFDPRAEAEAARRKRSGGREQEGGKEKNSSRGVAELMRRGLLPFRSRSHFVLRYTLRVVGVLRCAVKREEGAGRGRRRGAADSTTGWARVSQEWQDELIQSSASLCRTTPANEYDGRKKRVNFCPLPLDLRPALVQLQSRLKRSADS